MDKLITNNGSYRCSCNGMSPDALVKVVQGNDLTLDIQLTKHNTETDTWESYSLVGKDDVQCYLLTPNGTHINLDTEVQLDGKVKAKAESYQLETNMTYGIGVDWKDDDNDLSVKAKGMVKVVRYSEVTEDYEITVTDNATYISLGQLPEDYITPDELTTVLDNYVTNSSLSTTLEDYVQDSELDNYVTDTDLSTVLEDYVDETELSSTLSSYVSDNQLSSKLQLYATTQYVDDAIGDIDIDTSNFYTKTEIDTTLQSYITDSELNTTLQSYVTESELNTTLNPYITEIELDSTLGTTLNAYATSISIDGEHLIVGPSISKVISLKNSSNESISAIDLPAISVFNNNGTLNVKPANTATGLIKAADARKIYQDSIRIDDVESDISHLDTRVTNLENSSGGSGDVTMSYLDNYLEATAYALAQHELDLYTLNRNFSNYYDKTSSDSRYVTASQVSSKYVSTSTNENQNQATAYALTDLDGRVSTLEQGGGGGGSSATVNDATLTIQKNSVTVSTFTANASTNVTCDISVPTDTNDLTNGANFVSSTSITTIVQISQNDYDALVSGGTVDSNTMYVIV